MISEHTTGRMRRISMGDVNHQSDHYDAADVPTGAESTVVYFRLIQRENSLLCLRNLTMSTFTLAYSRLKTHRGRP